MRLKGRKTRELKLRYCERKGLSQKAFEDNILNALEKEKIEVIVLAGFMSILSADFVKALPREDNKRASVAYTVVLRRGLLRASSSRSGACTTALR